MFRQRYEKKEKVYYCLDGQSNSLDTISRVGIEVEHINNQTKGMLLANNENIEIVYDIPDSINAPVQKGQVIGNIIYQVNGEDFKIDYVIVIENVDKIDYKWCFIKVFDSFIYF